MTFVTMVFAQGGTVLLQLDGEGLVDLINRSTDDHASSGGVGFDDLQLMGMREVDYHPQLGGIGAVGGGKVFVGYVEDAGRGGILKIVQSIHGLPSRVAAKDKSSGDLFAGVSRPQLLMSGGVEVFAVGELDVI